MQEVLAQIPSLEDHGDYAACCAQIAGLQAKLAEAQAELTALGDQPTIPSAEDDATDLDQAINEHQKKAEKYERDRMRITLKIGMIQRALAKEQKRAPELRKQAEDLVGNAASQLHKAQVAEMYRLRDELSAAWSLGNAIRLKVRGELNKLAPGHAGYWRFEEPYCWGPEHSSVLPRAASESLIADAVAGGQMQFKHQVHEPAAGKMRDLAQRFESILTKFVR